MTGAHVNTTRLLRTEARRRIVGHVYLWTFLLLVAGLATWSPAWWVWLAIATVGCWIAVLLAIVVNALLERELRAVDRHHHRTGDTHGRP